MIDAHVHLISRSLMLPNLQKWGIEPSEVFKRMGLDRDYSMEELKAAWLAALEANTLEKLLFVSVTPGSSLFREFVNSSPGFSGIAAVNPLDPDYMEALETDIKGGLKGIKLYPVTWGFSVADKSLYPVYEYCMKLKLPVLIHFGVTIAPRCDLRFGNPLDLSPVISDFPGINFIIAHFGAGFLRETMMLTYKRHNVYLDTSGTNNWLDLYPSNLSLSDIFETALRAVGPERLIFGTDSRLLIDKYRSGILKLQKSIIEKLLPAKDSELVMGGNAARVYGL